MEWTIRLEVKTGRGEVESLALTTLTRPAGTTAAECTSATRAASRRRCSSGLRPRGLLTSPFAPSAAKRWQVSITPVRLSPTCSAISL